MSSSGRIAIITGANRGIGRSAALHLARDGVGVILTYRSHAEEAAEVVKEITDLGPAAVALELDAGDVGSFDGFVTTVTDVVKQTWGRDSFDYLVNNAGMQIPMSFGEVTEENFDRVVNVYFKGVYFLTQKLSGLLADNGAVVNVSSAMTRFYVPQRIVYSAAKGATEVLTRYLAEDLGGRGIRVNTVAPGPIATDFSDGLLRDNQQVQDQIVGVTALSRIALADDAGAAIAAMLRDDNRWVTGQRIEVSGGIHL
ncbi:NAD(P)-dependent dehydrogenase (short-subunit alcohol dehydrogenase family) [Asanoa ferruginea]|uniref:NAD(P)-dependent dehydrogenase (Short-subunit alcohol dehydrogenase family) n=1 Tax=Asanoa ferruginea TaxID=53367 RepID=A0A3D9ZLH4_9ACTN|nr:SDR family oxidoreductase [Asanoa ferruginea]REF97444.1 NAD(P)-dependent dehydrogenase (short-subunit alcohol dehydrogenase family) [Asanoa ferruginea]GIF48272.1 short-chain dehydrogenase [Asanoa ferruginea]